MDRLTGVSYPDGESINYSYDAMDNRVEKVTNNGTTSYSYNALNQLVSAGNINYEYDKEGKLIKKETSNNVFDYQYNAYDRLAKVKKDGTKIASYQYNPRGKRVSVTEEGNTTEYLWQGNSLLASYVNSSREKLYAVGNGMDEVLGVYGNETSYLHSNHLGSVKGITGVDGSVKGTKSYTPYGEVRGSTGDADTDLGFIGRRQSDVTGLTYIRARYYDASAGRFTKIDPIQDGLNWYGYTGGNPVKYVDRTGNSAALTAGTLGVAAGLSAADGPLPIGDALAVGYIAYKGYQYSGNPNRPFIDNQIDNSSKLAQRANESKQNYNKTPKDQQDRTKLPDKKQTSKPIKIKDFYTVAKKAADLVSQITIGSLALKEYNELCDKFNKNKNNKLKYKR